MQFKALKQMFTSLMAALADHQRFYKLDENYIVGMQLSGYVGADAEPDDRQPSLIVYQKTSTQRGDEIDIEWERAELEDVPGRHLVRFAELRGTIDKWVAGELAELPPSTAESPFKDISRPGRRRRRG